MENFLFDIPSRTMVSRFVLFFQTHIFLLENICCEPSFCKDYIILSCLLPITLTLLAHPQIVHLGHTHRRLLFSVFSENSSLLNLEHFNGRHCKYCSICCQYFLLLCYIICILGDPFSYSQVKAMQDEQSASFAVSSSLSLSKYRLNQKFPLIYLYCSYLLFLAISFRPLAFESSFSVISQLQS